MAVNRGETILGITVRTRTLCYTVPRKIIIRIDGIVHIIIFARSRAAPWVGNNNIIIHYDIAERRGGVCAPHFHSLLVHNTTPNMVLSTEMS